MTVDQAILLLVLLGTMGMFLWGRWRHDMIAVGALLACVLAGLVPAGSAFDGFGHPAVITVACVLVLSHGLQSAGAMDALVRRLLPSSAGPVLSIVSITTLAALLSGFMNNVGALALLMPVALQMAAKQDLPPARILMPLAFGSILGGMTTLIGTPPNLIVSGFRAEQGMGAFRMFHFTPVGLAVAAAGVLFIALAGWRLVPARKRADTDGFETGTYLSEVRIVEGSKAAGKRVREVEEILEEADAQVIGMVRHDIHVAAPNPGRLLRADDILVIEAEPESLASALSSLGLKLEEEVEPEEEGEQEQDQDQEQEQEREKGVGQEIVTREVAVMPNAFLIGRSATDLQLRTRFGINLLAVSRQGRRSIKRLRTTRLQAGDVLLLHGTPEALAAFASEFRCLPLAERDVRVPKKGQALPAVLVMGAAVLATATGLAPAAIAFAAAALVYIALRIVPARSVYTAIDWPVIVLLAGLLPVAGAMATTGAADLVARVLLENVAQGHAVFALVLILVVTMFLSDVMNNAATAAVMCPIAISTAVQLGVNPDAFLMGVAVGASCAFLTPIGHQNNTLILGPGGLRFGDYWRLGLPLEALVVAVSVPMILLVWPL